MWMVAPSKKVQAMASEEMARRDPRLRRWQSGVGAEKVEGDAGEEGKEDGDGSVHDGPKVGDDR